MLMQPIPRRSLQKMCVTNSLATYSPPSSAGWLALTYAHVLQLDIRGLNITIGRREILSDAQLKLHYGVHYAVVGRNGVGKSCLCPPSLW